MDIHCVAYGEDTDKDGNTYFYVQTRLNKDMGYYSTLENAKWEAEKIAQGLCLPIQYDNEANE